MFVPVRRVALLTSLLYLVFMPPGMFGLALASVGYLVIAAGSPAAILGCFLVTYGMRVNGILAQAVGIQHAGSVLSLLTGTVILFVLRPPRERLQWGRPGAWLGMVSGLLAVSFFMGPMSSYSSEKLATFILVCLAWCIAVDRLAVDSSCDLISLGLLCISSSVAYYAAVLVLYPEARPESIFEIAGLYRLRMMSPETAFSTNNLAMIPAFGFAACLGQAIDHQVSLGDLVVILLGSAIAILILSSAGQRLFMLSIPLIVFAILAAYPKNRWLTYLAFATSVIAVVSIVVLAAGGGDVRFSGLLSADQKLSERANRSINWEAGVDRTRERPLTGYGLGGYFIEGYSLPGSGTYAHNLILELTSETGIPFTIAILGPALMFLLRRRRWLRASRLRGGGSVIGILVLFVLHALGSHDLMESAALFGLIGSCWAAYDRSRRAQTMSIAERRVRDGSLR